jgi:hypothetical protein
MIENSLESGDEGKRNLTLGFFGDFFSVIGDLFKESH